MIWNRWFDNLLKYAFRNIWLLRSTYFITVFTQWVWCEQMIWYGFMVYSSLVDKYWLFIVHKGGFKKIRIGVHDLSIFLFAFTFWCNISYFDGFLGRSTAWIIGRIPPEALKTPPSKLFVHVSFVKNLFPQFLMVGLINVLLLEVYHLCVCIGFLDTCFRDGCWHIWVREVFQCLCNDGLLTAIYVGRPNIPLQLLHCPSKLVRGSCPKI